LFNHEDRKFRSHNQICYPVVTGTRILVLVATLLIAVWIWEALVPFSLPEFILPTPESCGAAFREAIADAPAAQSGRDGDGSGAGMLAGSLLATLLGYLLSKSHLLESLLSPFLVARARPFPLWPSRRCW